jgi:hypothetical protein
MSDDSQVWPKVSEVVNESAAENQATDKLIVGPLKTGPGQVFDIVKCAACDNRHDATPMHEYTRQSGLFTHWYACPNLGDPVSVTLMQLSNGNGIELHAETIQSLARAMIAGRFMAVIFYVEGDKLQMDRRSWKFPPTDFFPNSTGPGCLGMLEQSLRAEMGNVQPQDMKLAERPRPLRELSGAAAPGPRKEVFQLPKATGLTDRVNGESAAE